MKNKMTALCALLFVTQITYAAQAPSKKDVLSWPRTKADQFGCFLEKELGYKDPRFNCSLKNYVNQGSPCTATTEWTEGPAFPHKKAKTIHPLIEDINLAWEHGDLQGVSLTLRKKLTKKAVRKAFNLPKEESYPPSRANVSSISIQDCSLKATCLIIQGFDHQGAGETDCTAEISKD